MKYTTTEPRTERVAFRIGKTKLKRLTALAKKHRISKSELFRILIDDALEEDKASINIASNDS